MTDANNHVVDDAGYMRTTSETLLHVADTLRSTAQGLDKIEWDDALADVAEMWGPESIDDARSGAVVRLREMVKTLQREIDALSAPRIDEREGGAQYQQGKYRQGWDADHSIIK